MSMDALGPTLDLHGGGTDLVFPHHESEIAQARHHRTNVLAALDALGDGQLRGREMSKSLGSLVFISDLLKVADPRAIRLALMRHHYRAGRWHDTDLDEGNALLHRLLAAAGRGRADPRRAGASERARRRSRCTGRSRRSTTSPARSSRTVPIPPAPPCSTSSEPDRRRPPSARRPPVAPTALVLRISRIECSGITRSA